MLTAFGVTTWAVNRVGWAFGYYPYSNPYASGTTYVDTGADFGETSCRSGALGRFESRYLMVQALAAAGRLNKFGA